MERLSDDEFLAIMLSDGAVIEEREGEWGAWNRGPATMGTSIVGTTELMYWLVDFPEDMDRFYALLGDSIVRYYSLLSRAQGSTVRGFSWLDDNCYLFSPSLYERYCLPLMQKVFAAFAPMPGDYRYQHSDSAMEHLLPLLATLDLKGVNFGPTVPVQAIRRAMPRAEIQGQVAPFTLRNGSLEDVVAEVRRDFDAVGGDGGLLITTAGSIAAGTSLESIRGFMWAVETYCRYDR
jgi:uroporphyrinogen decarboxylase